MFITSIGIELFPLNYRLKKNIRILLPQGWAFFTRDPDREMIEVYQWQNDHYAKVTSKVSEPVNMLGFSRKNRVLRREATTVAGKIPDSLWKDTFSNDSMNSTVYLYKINNGEYLPMMESNRWLIAKSRPVLFSNRYDSSVQYKYAQVTVK